MIHLCMKLFIAYNDRPMERFIVKGFPKSSYLSSFICQGLTLVEQNVLQHYQHNALALPVEVHCGKHVYLLSAALGVDVTPVAVFAAPISSDSDSPVSNMFFSQNKNR